MDRARHTISKTVINAETAASRRARRLPDYQDRHGFECSDCGAPMTCINFDVSPLEIATKGMGHAFSTRWTGEKNHKPTCRFRLSEPACLWKLIDRTTRQHTDDERALRLYLPKPEVKRAGRSSSTLTDSEDLVTGARAHSARGSLAQLMWAPEPDILHAIHNRPKTTIITGGQRFPARDFVTPSVKLNTALCGSGVVFGAAKVTKAEKPSKNGDEYYIVRFATTSDIHGYISARLWPNVLDDNPLNREVLSNLQSHYYDVAIWWRKAAPPSPQFNPSGKPALWLDSIGAVAVKDY